MAKTEKQLWQEFCANLVKIKYWHRPSQKPVQELLDIDGVWIPTAEDFKYIYRWIFGSEMVPWQKLDGTEMSSRMRVIDEEGKIVLKPNGQPLKLQMNLVYHWQSHYNRALEKGELEGKVLENLRDGIIPDIVDSDNIDEERIKRLLENATDEKIKQLLEII